MAVGADRPLVQNNHRPLAVWCFMCSKRNVEGNKGGELYRRRGKDDEQGGDVVAPCRVPKLKLFNHAKHAWGTDELPETVRSWSRCRAFFGAKVHVTYWHFPFHHFPSIQAQHMKAMASASNTPPKSTRLLNTSTGRQCYAHPSPPERLPQYQACRTCCDGGFQEYNRHCRDHRSRT